MKSTWPGIAAVVLCLPAAGTAFGACKIGQMAELPVAVRANRPLLQGQINGQPVEILVDTGASSSFMWEGAAERLGLKMSGVSGLRIYGAGGEAVVHETVVRELKIGAFAAKNLYLAVINPKAGRLAGQPALVLGESFFASFVTEFDLAHGVIRLLKPEGCQLDQLPYWADSFSLAELTPGSDPWNQKIQTRVMLNGKPVDAMLDSGAYTSVVARPIAADAGVTPWLDHQTAFKTSGVSGAMMDTWVGTFATFAIGDESIRNVKLQISDLFNADRVTDTGSHISHIAPGLPNMLIGCDFFLSHRILVLFNARKLLFTYNGGPVFQVVESVESGGDPAVPAP
jgi:clan AA aspartic protease (TIGR02281 family)